MRRVAVLLLAVGAHGAAAAPGIVWPTPNDAFNRGLSYEAFVQPTASGRPQSGLFGCVRNGGSRFHEGLDLFPLKRTANGRATDPAYAVLPGRVVYVNAKAGASNYGRYVVVLHEDQRPAFHTLYAHLATIGSGIAVGTRVEAGTELGVIGNTPSHIIPVSRSHLHFEMGFKLTDRFDSWYGRQGYGSTNSHGVWNGINLLGVDPLSYYTAYREGQVKNMQEFLRRETPVARVRVRTASVPSFIRNYPSLKTEPLDTGRDLAGWELTFNQYGIPGAWKPLYADGDPPGGGRSVTLVAYNPEAARRGTCRPVVVLDKDDRPSLAPGAAATIEKIFAR